MPIRLSGARSRVRVLWHAFRPTSRRTRSPQSLRCSRSRKLAVPETRSFLAITSAEATYLSAAAPPTAMEVEVDGKKDVHDGASAGSIGAVSSDASTPIS